MLQVASCKVATCNLKLVMALSKFYEQHPIDPAGTGLVSFVNSAPKELGQVAVLNIVTLNNLTIEAFSHLIILAFNHSLSFSTKSHRF